MCNWILLSDSSSFTLLQLNRKRDVVVVVACMCMTSILQFSPFILKKRVFDLLVLRNEAYCFQIFSFLVYSLLVIF